MKDDLAGLLRKYGVLLEGHFLLASGRHSDRYFEKFRILEHPELCEEFAKRIAREYRDRGVTVVCGPTTGGVIIAYEVARQLGARCIIAEPAEQGRKIGRGFAVSAADRVLVVDDVMTTGGSVVDTLAALTGFPGEVLGVAVFIDRSGGRHRVDRPVRGIYSQEFETWDPAECPLCRQGVELTTRGRSSRPPGRP